MKKVMQWLGFSQHYRVVGNRHHFTYATYAVAEEVASGIKDARIEVRWASRWKEAGRK